MKKEQWVQAFRERLRQAVDGYRSVNALALAIERSEGTIRNWLTGPALPTVWDLVAICEETGRTLSWFLVGTPGETLLREERASYGTSTDAQAADLLQQTVERVNVELRAANRELVPSKHGELVVILYEIFRARGEVDSSMISRLVRLAS